MNEGVAGMVVRIKQRFISSQIDVFNGGNNPEVELNANCGGAPDNNLVVIPDGSIITLRTCKASRKVVIRQGEASECVANFILINRAIAQALGLVFNARYIATYDSLKKTLTFRRKRVTIVNLRLTNGPKLSPSSVAIGDGLAIAMGNYLNGGELLAVKHGNVRLRLRYVRLTQNDIFNNNFRLNPVTIRKLALKSGTKYQVSYNQTTREIGFIKQL